MSIPIMSAIYTATSAHQPPRFVYCDGGPAAGYKGDAGDCTSRAIAAVARMPYWQVYDLIQELRDEIGVIEILEEHVPLPRRYLVDRLLRLIVLPEIGAD